MSLNQSQIAHLWPYISSPEVYADWMSNMALLIYNIFTWLGQWYENIKGYFCCHEMDTISLYKTKIIFHTNKQPAYPWMLLTGGKQIVPFVLLQISC